MADDDTTASDVADWLRRVGVGAGEDVGLALVDGMGVGLATQAGCESFAHSDPAALVAWLDSRAFGPRWVWWDRSTADRLVAGGVAITRCWDVLTVHRLLHGGFRASVAGTWAWLHDLSLDSLPAMGQLGLLDDHGDEGDDPEQPVRPDGHLRPEWVTGGWAARLPRLASWAGLALAASVEQRRRLVAASAAGARPVDREIGIGGRVPVRRADRERICRWTWPRRSGSSVRRSGRVLATAPRRSMVNVGATSAVLQHLGPGSGIDLRNPADVRAMLRRVAIDVPDTRAWQAGAASRRASCGRRLADVAQGGANRHHLRVPVAGRACVRGPAAGRVDE